jgi:membrane-associated protein
MLTYALLFGIIFIETGIVIMPFLPWDSLLFAAGALAAISEGLNVFLLWGLVFIAAVVGDTANYEIGKFLWKKAFAKYPKIFKPQYLEKTEAFYDKYGPLTIIYARFVPIVRTFAPFIAWVGKMKYRKFISYNVVGGLVRTSLFVWVGYFFGNLKFVQEYFSLIILAIILISVCPIIIGRLIGKLKKQK